MLFRSAKYTGRIIYHLSASNWAVVLHRIRQRIHGLAGASDAEQDTADLQLITYSALDRAKLVQCLQGGEYCTVKQYCLTLCRCARAFFAADEPEEGRSGTGLDRAEDGRVELD